MYPNRVFRSRYTWRLDGLAICTMADLVADQLRTVRAVTNLWNVLGTSDGWTSSAVTLRGSINGAVVFAGALTVSTCSIAISCCGGIYHFLVRYTGTDSTVLSTSTIRRESTREETAEIFSR